MIHDNSDTTHLDAYPAKRAWSQLPWWVRVAVPILAAVAFFIWVLVSPRELFTPQSPWGVASSVLTVAVFSISPLLNLRTMRKNPEPSLRSWSNLVFSLIPLVVFLLVGSLARAGAGDGVMLAVTAVALLMLILGLGIMIVDIWASFRSAFPPPRPEPPRLDDLDS